MKTVQADRSECAPPERVPETNLFAKKSSEAGLCNSAFFIGLKGQRRMRQSDAEKWKILKYKALELQIVELFKLFRSHGIEPILIKGWAASLYYPRRYERIFSDFDLAVAPRLFGRAAALLDAQKLTVDLHRGLEKHDTYDWNDLFENSVFEKIDGYEIRIPRPEDHLRVLCVHWLMDGGAYREKLWDVFYLIEKNGSDFDWQRCLGGLDGKRRRWILTVIALTRKYFNLDVSKIPFREELSDVPGWVYETVEYEWANPLPLRPLHACLDDRRMLFKQIRKRIPPNKIQATVELNGEFDHSSRAKYQFLNMFQRVFPTFQRVTRTFLTGKKY